MMTSLLLGVGLGTGVANSVKWQALYDGTPGSLLMAGYDRLGVFGKICAFINVLTVISNNAPGSYSMAMNFQMLGEVWSKVPRPIFTIGSTIIYTACAIGGRNFLYQIFKNFLPLIGYWIIIWFTIAVEEDVLFNRCRGYDWTIWNDWRKLPVGVAAGVSFLIGWAGAIVGMVCELSHFSSLKVACNRPYLLTARVPNRTKFTTLGQLRMRSQEVVILESGSAWGSRPYLFLL